MPRPFTMASLAGRRCMRTLSIEKRGLLVDFRSRISGERIWFSYGIVSPINFVMRHFYGYRKKYPNKMNEIVDFYLASYCFNYDILRDGIFPYQRNLGPFGYPGHTIRSLQL